MFLQIIYNFVFMSRLIPHPLIVSHAKVGAGISSFRRFVGRRRRGTDLRFLLIHANINLFISVCYILCMSTRCICRLPGQMFRLLLYFFLISGAFIVFKIAVGIA